MSIKSRAAVVEEKGKPTVIKEIEVPEPKRGEVLVNVKACGVCAGDGMARNSGMVNYPRVPGHEIAGVVVSVGEGVNKWKKGDRVGAGWYGGCCGECDQCHKSEPSTCEKHYTNAVSFNGGFADYAVLRSEALARIPDELSFVEAAPLLCAGLTSFNSLRQVKPSSRVIIQGIGSIGHLAIQFSKSMGFETIAISKGEDKKKLSLELGADHFIDYSTQNAVEEVKKLGGADALFCLAPQEKAISSLFPVLSPRATIFIIAVPNNPIEVSGGLFVMKQLTLRGWYSGVASDNQETMEYAAKNKIKAHVKVFPLEKLEEAWNELKAGKLLFKAVIDLEKK